MRFVFPGQEALEVLERLGTTKDECTIRLQQILASEKVQLSVFGKRVSPETIELSDDPRQQGGYSFTYYISIKENSEERRFVAQFREDGIERTSLDLLNAAEAVFGSYVAKPLFISMENKVQVTIWEYYGETISHKFWYHEFTLEQKKTAMRQYAAFLALGCRDGLTHSPSNSKVYETFQRLATWSFPPSIASIISSLNASLGFLTSRARTNK